MKNCVRDNKEQSWYEIKSDLSKMYLNKSRQLNLRQKMRDLNSKNFSSLSAYTDEFCRLAAAIEDLS
jgi:hypothetical protein